jgi:thioredoxin 1
MIGSRRCDGRRTRVLSTIRVLIPLFVLLTLGVGGCGGDGEGDRRADSETASETAALENAPESTPAASGDALESAPAASGDAPESTPAAESGLPRLLDLGADKCVPCKAMAPILEEMRETFAGQLRVDFIDVWKNREAGSQYGIKVIPTQIFFDENGNELFRHQGFFSREDMLAKWGELGYEFEG